jgi:hypothetical protein
MRKLILALVCAFACTFNLKAQLNDGFESILLADEDAEKLIGAYINPAMKGLVYGMNNGWYHTAKVHKTFGFDISIGLNSSFAPSKDEIFRFADLGLTSTTSSATTAPTVLGADIETPVTFSGSIVGDDGNTYTASASFNLPPGVKDEIPLGGAPSPAVQIGVGLPWKMDAMLRLVPSVGSDDIKGNLMGIGLKKEITSWFGPMDKTPLHVSILAAYTKMTVDYDIQADSSIGGSNQKAEFDLNAYTVEAIASLNFPFINVFGGIGYNTGNSDVKMLGTYQLEYETGLAAPNDIVQETITDPVNLSFDAGGFKTTLGARISLGFFKIFGSYTFQEYNTLNAGIAFSFR